MTRQITITMDGVQHMVDVDIEREHTNIVYHVSTPQHFRDELPESFDIIRPENADQPQYDGQQFKGKGKEVARAIWHQLASLPPQFQGNTKESEV